MKNVEEPHLRRSKRLTKNNSIGELNNPVNENDYRKHRKTSQLVTTTGDDRRNAGAGQRRKPLNRSHNQMVQQSETKHADHGTLDLPPAGLGLSTDHTRKLDSIETPFDISHSIAEGE